MIKELEKKLHTEIPMTEYMQIQVEGIEDNHLITSAPIEPNINDKGTGFAGSLSTLVTISAWSACYLEVAKLGYKESMIAVVRGDTSYRLPITKNFRCETTFPSKKDIQIIKKKLRENQSASIKIKSLIKEDEHICVEFVGIYVIKV